MDAVCRAGVRLTVNQAVLHSQGSSATERAQSGIFVTGTTPPPDAPSRKERSSSCTRRCPKASSSSTPRRRAASPRYFRPRPSAPQIRPRSTRSQHRRRGGPSLPIFRRRQSKRPAKCSARRPRRPPGFRRRVQRSSPGVTALRSSASPKGGAALTPAVTTALTAGRFSCNRATPSSREVRAETHLARSSADHATVRLLGHGHGTGAPGSRGHEGRRAALPYGFADPRGKLRPRDERTAGHLCAAGDLRSGGLAPTIEAACCARDEPTRGHQAGHRFNRRADAL